MRSTLGVVVRTSIMRVIGLGVFGLVAACAGDDGPSDEVDCTKVTGTDEFRVGLEKVGNNGLLNFQMLSAEPAPPQRGDNTWLIQINAMQSGVIGAPLEGAMLTITPFMPEHQHGSPIRAEATPADEAGQYTVEPVNLWMPGVWETTIRATQGATIDSAIFRFCIN